MKKLSLIVVCLLIGFATAFAQDKDGKLPYNRWEFGVNIGLAKFAGSTNIHNIYNFNNFNDFKCDFDPGYGLLIRKNFTHVFALEGTYNGTTLTGSPTIAGDVAFKTGLNEFGLNTVWNINNLFSRNKFDRMVYWYAKIGTGITHVKNIEYTLPATIQGPWRYWTVPIGTGIVIRYSDKIRFDIGTQWSWVNSNELDGVLQGGQLALVVVLIDRRGVDAGAAAQGGCGADRHRPRPDRLPRRRHLPRSRCRGDRK